MASSGQFVFSVTNNSVNLVLTADGTSPPPTDAFDIAVFTTANGTPPAGYEGSAFAPGGMLVNNFLVAPRLELNNGAYQVNDFGGSDTIAAGSSNQTIVGGIFTTVVGGNGALNVIAGDRGVVTAGDAAAVTVNALVDDAAISRGELVGIGSGNATVFATGDDTVNAGSGLGNVLYLHGAGDTVVSSLTIQGATADPTYTISGGPGDSLIGGAQILNAVLSGGRQVEVNSGTATINALSGNQAIRLGGASGTVYADAGVTVFAGGGQDVVLLAHEPDTVVSTVFLEGDAADTTLTIMGAGSQSFVASAANVSVIGSAGDSIQIGAAKSAATVNALRGAQHVVLCGHPATVYAGTFESQGDTVLSVDTVVAGAGNGLIVLGETNSSFLTVSGAGGAYTVASGERELVGAASNVNAISLATETISGGEVSNITVNALNGSSAQLIDLGSGNATVYADGGDTINAGSGGALGVLESGQELTVTGSAAAPNITIISGTDVVLASAENASLLGAEGDTIIAGRGSQVINAVSKVSLNEQIIVSGGADTVFAGDGDTIGVGPDAAPGQTVTGIALYLDSSVPGGGDVGYGTFLSDTTGTASAAQVTVGTVTGGAASESFDLSGDYLFYPDADATKNAAILATATPVDIGGVASQRVTFLDGTEMTLVGVTDLTGIVFKSA